MTGAIRTPPHSLEAERAVLTSALLDGASAVLACEGLITESDFWSEPHRAIWLGCIAVVRRGHGLDEVTLRETVTAVCALDCVAGTPSILRVLD